MFARLVSRVAGSLRYKLLLLVLVPILVVAPATVGFAIYWSQEFSHDQLLRRVSADLTVTHDLFRRTQDDLLQQLELLAASHAFVTALEAHDAARIRNQLAVVRDTTGFQFLHVTDAHGRWLYGPDPFAPGTAVSSPLQQQVITSGTAGVGIEVYGPDQLAEIDDSLPDAVRLPLIPASGARPTLRRYETRAMVVRAIAPVRDINGTRIALLDGGMVLNRNTKVVDSIRDLVYGPGSLPEGSFGAVTILLDDVRIATNVPLPNGERALGTRVSANVRDSVQVKGQTRIDRALVVNDWFISAYEPIVDVYGTRVGMLHTGFLEAPFRAAYLHTVAISFGMVLVGIVLTALLAVRGARAVFRPIESIARVVRAVQAGDESARIGAVASRDEIGELAREFDHTLDLLRQRNEEVRQAAERLESKVEERTRELRDKNERLEETIGLLQATRQQLVAAEKLAAIGELTAGVAHEINNPIAVIQGNLEVLRHELGDAIEPVQTEIDLVIEQVERIGSIVQKLLSYSRHSARRTRPVDVSLGPLIADTLVLVRHELEVKGLEVRTVHRETGPVCIDASELQQVLVNLLANAAQASAPGGEILVETRDEGPDSVAIAVTDHGSGIPEADLARVFDPFFSTKGPSGTGLGLSVSHGIVRAYGGDISVRSHPGDGTTFTVLLLRRPPGETSIDAEADEPNMQRRRA